MSNARKPDNVLKLSGTYQKHRHGDPDTKPKWLDEPPEPPEWLKGHALIEWKRILDKTPSGVVTHTDMALFTRYCVLWGIYSESEGVLGATLYTEMRLHEKELGFTPISRGKIGGAPKKQDDSGPQTVPR